MTGLCLSVFLVVCFSSANADGDLVYSSKCEGNDGCYLNLDNAVTNSPCMWGNTGYHFCGTTTGDGMQQSGYKFMEACTADEGGDTTSVTCWEVYTDMGYFTLSNIKESLENDTAGAGSLGCLDRNVYTSKDSNKLLDDSDKIYGFMVKGSHAEYSNFDYLQIMIAYETRPCIVGDSCYNWQDP